MSDHALPITQPKRREINRAGAKNKNPGSPRGRSARTPRTPTCLALNCDSRLPPQLQLPPAHRGSFLLRAAIKIKKIGRYDNGSCAPRPPLAHKVASSRRGTKRMCSRVFPSFHPQRMQNDGSEVTDCNNEQKQRDGPVATAVPCAYTGIRDIAKPGDGTRSSWGTVKTSHFLHFFQKGRFCCIFKRFCYTSNASVSFRILISPKRISVNFTPALRENMTALREIVNSARRAALRHCKFCSATQPH